LFRECRRRCADATVYRAKRHSRGEVLFSQ
jgi:hypothetical protein